MKLTVKLLIALGGVALLAACTPRRTDAPAEADGDTIQVVISTPTGLTTDSI